MRSISKAWFLTIILIAAPAIYSQELITNAEIVGLTAAGLSKALIIRKIEISTTDFDVSTKGLIELKRAGVADDVIEMMMLRHSAQPAAKVANMPARPEPPARATAPPTPSDADVPERPARSTIATADDAEPPSVPDEATDPVCLRARLDGDNTGNYDKTLCSLVQKVMAESPNPRISVANSLTELSTLFVTQLARKNKLFENDAERMEAAQDLFLEADKKRTDKQIGGGPANAGTTSLAVKGGGPSIIGWAVEHGGATSSINGNTVTVRVNPFGLVRALQGEGFLGSDFMSSLLRSRRGPSDEPDREFSNALRKFSTSVSFDMTRGVDSPVFIASRQQISAFSARYEFINQRNPQSARARQLFAEYVANSRPDLAAMSEVARNLYDTTARRYRNDELNRWVQDTNAAIAEVPNPTLDRLRENLTNIRDRFTEATKRIEQLRKILPLDTDQLDELLEWMNDPESSLDAISSLLSDFTPLIDPVGHRRYEESLRAAIEKRLAVVPVEAMVNDAIVKTSFESFGTISMNFAERRRLFLSELNKGSIATFEYTNNREPIAPDTSNFRFIWENGRLFRRTDLTLNASVTIYNKRPVFAGVKRFRDFQLTLQTDTSLGNTFGTGDTILTFAGKYERLNGDTIDQFGIVYPNTSGDTAVGQFKFTVPIADWGIRLPFSVTFANRTDLIKESKVRANFGFTFDLDPIFARFKPF